VLTREILRRVREIEVRTGRDVADVLAGEYVSVFKGRGVEFDEVRPYVPGDDVRTIDWNVTARTGTPHVKRYVEERQLTVMLVADVSASQDFGSAARSKRETTAELCALLAFSAARNDDKVGLVLFHGDIEQYIPPRKGQKHALRVVREVLAHGAEPGSDGPRGAAGFLGRLRRRATRQETDIAHAMEFLMSGTPRKTICFVVSDFLDEGFEQALAAANRKHDVVAVCISDEREAELPGVGLVALKDAETGRTRLYDTSSQAFQQQLRRDADERIEDLRHRLASAGIDFIHIQTADSVVEPLVRFFRMRERRARR
jgi:uncharacterized protein (DUF58 family)